MKYIWAFSFPDWSQILIITRCVNLHLFSLSDTGIKPDEFMNNKKSHEVQVMSELVDRLANYCGIKQVRRHFLLCVTRYLLCYSPYCVQGHHFDILSLLFLFFLYIIGAKEELLGPSWRTILFTNVLFQRSCLSVTQNHSWGIL